MDRPRTPWSFSLRTTARGSPTETTPEVPCPIAKARVRLGKAGKENPLSPAGPKNCPLKSGRRSPYGRDGLPGEYRMVDLEEIELYDLDNDESETINVADEHPEIVDKIKVLAE